MLIKLQENKSKRVQVAKVGTFDHKVYGRFSILLSDLEKMKTNFQGNVRRQEIDDCPVIPFDYKHEEEDKAAGWITNLEIEKDKNGIDALFAEVDWTLKAADKIRGNEFKFVSPSIRRNYKDAETGKTFDVILKGATLTNVPFLRDMEAVHLLSESRKKAFESLKQSGDNPDTILKKGKNMSALTKKFKSLSPEEQSIFLSECKLKREEDNKKLSEDLKEAKKDLKKSQDDFKLSEKTLKNLKTKMADSGDQADRLKLAEDKAEDLSKKVLSLTKELANDKKKAEFDQMLSEGKVCEAQRKAFMDDNMIEFAQNMQEIKLDEAGDGDAGDKNNSESDAQEKLIELSEAKVKEKEISYGTAMSQVLTENPKLRKAAGY